ncbi:unnamed protein product [Ectocarpus sp. 6 AP-2014]
MIMKLVLAASAAFASLTPASAFVTTAPRVASLPAAGQQYRSFTSSNAGARGAVAAPLSMMSGDGQAGLVTVYHKETCPYCKKALALLENDYSLQVTRVNVLEGEDSEKKIKQMKTFSGANTVPQVFFNSEHLGGNDDVQKLHEDGKLEELVKKVRAEAPGMMKDSWYHPWY